MVKQFSSVYIIIFVFPVTELQDSSFLYRAFKKVVVRWPRTCFCPLTFTARQTIDIKVSEQAVVWISSFAKDISTNKWEFFSFS
jgi:hypothetical protein